MTFRIHNQHSYDVISIVSNDFLGIVEEFDNDNYTISNFRGFAITHRAVLTEETPKGDVGNHTVRELSESPGEWAAMAHSNQSDGVEYLYFTDRFGYSPIFYSTQSQSHIVISSTFSGVVAGLRHLGEDCTLNVVNYSATIASNVPFFQNSFSHETMANEIFILPAKYALKITKIGWALVDRESLDGTAQITEYADALLRGVEQTKAVVDTIVASNALNRRITLTGGVDSRLCAALLSKSGKLQNFRVSTIDSRKWEGRPGQRGINRDIVISNEIRKKFGLEWWSLPERIKKPWEFIESLAAFQSYRSNFAYTFVPSAGHVRFAKPVISIRGGGGEILRVDATMEKIATEFETAAAQQASGCLDEGLWYANHVMRGSLLSGSLRSEAIERIAANFPRNYGNSFLERISKLYLDHRYRGHFGHQRQTTSANDIILHPLSNTYFLKSSALADFDSLKSGRLVLDIFEAADPVFLEQTFASDDWSRLLTGRIGDESEYTSTEWIADFDASHVPSTITMDRSIKSDRQVAAPAQSLLETSLQYLSVAFEEINSRVPSVNIEEIKDLHKKIISRVKNSKYIPGYAVAKTASALECFYPLITGAMGNHYSTDLPNEISSAVPLLPEVDVADIALPRDGHNDFAVPLIDLRVLLSNGLLTAVAIPLGRSSKRLEYAFYAFQDSERFETQWYSESPSFSVSVLESHHQFKVEVFIRFAGSTQIIGKTSNHPREL